MIKSRVSVSHAQMRHGYDFLLYFPYEFLTNFISRFINKN